MKRYIIILIAILLVITGCGSGTGGETSADNYFTGSQGIVMNFMQGAPPNTVLVDSETLTTGDNRYTSDELSFGIEVKNLGAYPFTKNGANYNTAQPTIYLSGYESTLVDIGQDKYAVHTDLEPKNEENPAGGYNVITKPITFYLPQASTSYNTNINAIACYEYGTLATDTICLDPDPAHNENDVCTPSDVSFGGSQGAPVAVTSVEVDSIKNTAHLQVHISNIGGGEVVDKGSLNDCPFDLDYIEKDYVYIDKVRLGGESDQQAQENAAKCKPRDVRLQNGRATAFCKIEGLQNQDAAFVTTLQIELQYGYKSQITKSVTVKRI